MFLTISKHFSWRSFIWLFRNENCLNTNNIDDCGYYCEGIQMKNGASSWIDSRSNALDLTGFIEIQSFLQSVKLLHLYLLVKGSAVVDTSRYQY